MSQTVDNLILDLLEWIGPGRGARTPSKTGNVVLTIP